jgi:hypothetical protein
VVLEVQCYQQDLVDLVDLWHHWFLLGPVGLEGLWLLPDPQHHSDSHSKLYNCQNQLWLLH